VNAVTYSADLDQCDDETTTGKQKNSVVGSIEMFLPTAILFYI